MRLTSKSFKLLNAAVLCLGIGMTLASCSACNEPPDEPPDPNIALMAKAKKALAEGDYAQAMSLCERAEENDNSYDEAKYCILLAQFGALTKSSSAIFSLLAAQLKAPAYAPQAMDLKQLIGTILSDVENELLHIDRYAYKLAAMENPHFQIDDFPIALDPKDLLTIAGTSEVQVSGELRLNLRGTWDKSEVMLLGATVNAVQGALDYLLAHRLILASTDVSFDSTAAIADFLHLNPDLLVEDPAGAGRITGDGDRHKGLKNDVMAALSYLVGRDADLELVAPANGGLVAAIKASAAESGTYPDQVVKWVEVDANGIPKKVGLPAINDLKESILDADGKPLITEDTFDNPLQSATWTALIAFGKAVLANAEKGGGAVGLKIPLQAIVDDLGGDAEYADIRLLQKDVPDLLALNPGAFLNTPKFLGELLPYYYDYTVDGMTRVFDLAFEEERHDAGGGATLFIAGYSSDTTAADWAHFSYGADLAVNAGVTMSDFAFDDFAAAPQTIGLDGVAPDAKTPYLYYIALQDPSFGGLLEADTNFGGNYVPVAGNQAFNTGLNKLLKHYCLDFNTNADATDDSLFDAFEDSEYGPENKIAACPD